MTRRASGHKNFASIPLNSTWMTTKMGVVQPIVHHEQTNLPMRNNDGKPSQTAGRSSRHYDGHRPDALQGSWGEWKNTYNVPDCIIRFATWNIGTMSGRSAEVVETLHRRKIDVCCVQETRWTGAGAKVFNCTHCTTRYIGGQFVLSLKTSVHNNPLHHTTLVFAHHQHFSCQSHIRHELHHTHLHLYQRDHSDPSNNNQLRCWNALVFSCARVILYRYAGMLPVTLII